MKFQWQHKIKGLKCIKLLVGIGNIEIEICVLQLQFHIIVMHLWNAIVLLKYFNHVLCRYYFLQSCETEVVWYEYVDFNRIWIITVQLTGPENMLVEYYSNVSLSHQLCLLKSYVQKSSDCLPCPRYNVHLFSFQLCCVKAWPQFSVDEQMHTR